MTMIMLLKVLNAKVRTSPITNSAKMFSVASLLFIFSLQALSQTTTGRISGRISDSTGAILPGVTVNVIDEAKGIIRSSVTDNSGNYVVTNLLPAVYSVSIEHPGFKKVIKTGYDLTADGRLTVDLKLDIGDVNASVEVTSATGETVNTTSGEVARVVDGEQVRNLALNTRNFVELLSLIPGSVLTTDDPLGLASGSGTGSTTINGNRNASNNLMVDGGYNIGPTNNAIVVNNIGIDYIQEVKIQTSNFSAEYGRTSGAAINIVTRGGGNKFRGSIFEYLRNDIVDAKPRFAPVKAPLRYNNFGYSFGGPILKNKLFFFGGQEWKFIRRYTDPVNRTLPTLAELDGDFSYRLRGADNKVGTADDGRLTNPYAVDSKGKRFSCTATDKRGCFKDNIIPKSMITADGSGIANVYRSAIGLASAYNNSPTANNATFQMPNPYDFRQDMLRIDYKISNNHNLNGRYIHDINELGAPYGPANESQLPIAPFMRVRPGETYYLQHTWIISPTITNEARARTAKVDQRSFPTGDSWQRDKYGFVFPQVFLGERYDNGIPDVAITGGIAGWRGPQFALIQPLTEIGIDDNFVFIRGGHAVKLGLSYVRSRIDQNGRPRYTGNLAFNNNQNTNTTGNAFADALLGNYRTYNEAADDPRGFFRSTQFDFFVSDTWKVRRNLSFEVGARVQRYVPYYTQANNIANFDPALYDFSKAVTVKSDGTIDANKGGNRFNGLIRAGDGIPESELERIGGAATSPETLSVPAGARRGFYRDANTVAPRFSFAYSPFDDGKTSIRGGYGIFYDTIAGDIPIGLLNNPPFNSSVNFENGNLSNPSSGKAAALTPFTDINAFDVNLKRPYVMNYSLTIQRELAKGLFVDIGYVGNQARHLIRKPNINQVPFEKLADNPNKLVDNALRTYQGYSGIFMNLSDSNSNYNSLQLFVSKRKGNLVFTGSYTWSKAMNDSNAHGDNAEYPFDRGFNYGIASYDRRHVFVSTYTYSLPFFRKSPGITRALLSGYELTGKTRMQGGAYVTVVANAVGGARRADYIGGDILVPESERSAKSWINKSAFNVAPANRRGTSGIGNVPTPGIHTWDMSVRKIFNIAEKKRLRFQLDLFNVFNHPNLTSLSTNWSDSDFGQFDSTTQPRQIQLGLRFEF